MRLFKPKVAIGGVCGEFYNSRVFRPTLARKKRAPIVWDAVLKAIQDVDYSVSLVDQTVFVDELNALRIELFGLAWVHHLKDEDYIIREILFTKKYLDDMNRSNIWEGMGHYNRAIVDSADQVQERQGEREALTATWAGSGVDPECSTRAVNRLSTVEAWERGIIPERLVDTFADRIGCQLQPPGKAKLQEIIEQLYDDALREIKSVKVQVTVAV